MLDLPWSDIKTIIGHDVHSEDIFFAREQINNNKGQVYFPFIGYEGRDSKCLESDVGRDMDLVWLCTASWCRILKSSLRIVHRLDRMDKHLQQPLQEVHIDG